MNLSLSVTCSVGGIWEIDVGTEMVTDYCTGCSYLTYDINRLSSVLGKKFIQQSLHLDNLLSLNGYVCGLALHKEKDEGVDKLLTSRLSRQDYIILF